MQTQICCFPLPWGRYSFCSCRKVTERARSRPTVLSIPLCRRIVSTTHIKDYFNPYYYPRSRTLFIAYGNISNVILSEITLHVYFSIFVCTAHSQTNFFLIRYSHIARSNIAKNKFIAFIPHFSFHIPNLSFANEGR